MTSIGTKIPSSRERKFNSRRRQRPPAKKDQSLTNLVPENINQSTIQPKKKSLTQKYNRTRVTSQVQSPPRQKKNGKFSIITTNNSPELLSRMSMPNNSRPKSVNIQTKKEKSSNKKAKKTTVSFFFNENSS